MASGYQNEQSRQQQLNKSKLVVRIIEARGIKAADFGGTSDPYVEGIIVFSSYSKLRSNFVNSFYCNTTNLLYF